MQFRIADTFTDSLAKLTGDEQKAVKTTAFDLQMNLARPGLKLHALKGAKDKDFWSVRVSRDIRLNRPPDHVELPALLRGPSRRGVPVGGGAAAGAASDDRSGPARRDPRDGPRDSGATVRRGGRPGVQP